MELPTERECSICEEATYEEIDGDLVCPRCHYVMPDKPGRQVQRSDPWEDFWTHRAANYSGHHGPDRKKCVGGFIGAWTDHDFAE